MRTLHEAARTKYVCRGERVRDSDRLSSPTRRHVKMSRGRRSRAGLSVVEAIPELNKLDEREFLKPAFCFLRDCVPGLGLPPGLFVIIWPGREFRSVTLYPWAGHNETIRFMVLLWPFNNNNNNDNNNVADTGLTL